MKDKPTVFFEMPCLTEESPELKGVDVVKKWFKNADSRFVGQYLQKFIAYNLKEFQFIGVTPYVSGSDQKTCLSFRSSSFVGCIPLRSPDTGKQIGDFIVSPRFCNYDRFEDYIEIVSLLSQNIDPEVVESLPLMSGKNFGAPLYLEAVRFVRLLEKMMADQWSKFSSIEKTVNSPSGQVNWKKYIEKEFKVEQKMKFPVRKNVMSEIHQEYLELRYVFDLCKKEILSNKTPIRIRSEYKNRIDFLENRLYLHNPKVTHRITVKFSDSPKVKACKEQANRILNFNSLESTAWRVNFSDVYEKFVQYVFSATAMSIGANFYPNFKLRSKYLPEYSWGLRYLEPDGILLKDDVAIFIDAKYKSHLYNMSTKTDCLKEEFRRDLHQIMAYLSLSESRRKFGFLCYPSNDVKIEVIEYESSISRSSSCIFLLGIPLKVDSVRKVKECLIEKISYIEKEMN